ncbi:uncharacterized protein LOC132713744 [Ruditapes philippinarum]|uniref:uncharacterized protein LOC132713744 n=1 Tax=Ruditapes philippinarum TaxID=129788 RepID=UPI00295A7729|nr:uncharacterized protein LOC132713744 [Ruditapes philippinarum]
MTLKWLIIYICVGYLNTVSLQPKFVYKPTEFPYSRCFENGTNRMACEKLNISKERLEKQSMWPPGPYAIPMSKYGCPESKSQGWFKSFLKVSMITSENTSTVLYGDWLKRFVELYDILFKLPDRKENLTLYFCVKFRNEPTLDKEHWIPGNYSIYKIGPSCPTAFEELNGTLPVTNVVSSGHIPNIAVSKEGQSEETFSISMCRKMEFTDMADFHSTVTFKMLGTDFILEKARFLFSFL